MYVCTYVCMNALPFYVSSELGIPSVFRTERANHRGLVTSFALYLKCLMHASAGVVVSRQPQVSWWTTKANRET
jgi:hypothetical protein